MVVAIEYSYKPLAGSSGSRASKIYRAQHGMLASYKPSCVTSYSGVGTRKMLRGPEYRYL